MKKLKPLQNEEKGCQVKKNRTMNFSFYLMRNYGNQNLGAY